MTKDWIPSAVEKKFSSEITEEVTYPIMIPVMSSMILFLMRVDRKIISAMMTMAPIKALAMTDRNPDKAKVPAVMLPPPVSIIKATPRLEPELIPKMDESARGLLKTVCSIRPEAERAAPQSRAVMLCGKRDSQMIKFQLAFSEVSLDKIRSTSLKGISTEPNIKLAKSSNTITTDNAMP